MADQRPEPWRPMDTAPIDGTIVRLLVDYSDEDACHPLEDAEVAQTIGGNTDGHTGLSEGWKFAGWSWEQDRFCEGRGKPIGWLPFAHLDLTVANGVLETYAPSKASVKEVLELVRRIRESHAAWGGWSGIPETCDSIANLLRYDADGVSERDQQTFSASGTPGDHSL